MALDWTKRKAGLWLFNTSGVRALAPGIQPRTTMLDQLNTLNTTTAVDRVPVTVGDGSFTYKYLDFDKLLGVASGATANDTDANLRARASHTGTQAMETVAGLLDALAAKADLGLAASGIATYQNTLADLEEIAGSDGDLAFVLQDGDAENNGVYQSDGSDWTKIADLPDGYTPLSAGDVDNTKLAQVATATLKGRATAGTGEVEDLTAAQVKSVLALLASDMAEVANAKVMTAAERATLIAVDAARDGLGGFLFSVTDLAQRAVGFNADGQSVQGGAQIFPDVDRETDGELFPLFAAGDGVTLVGIDFKGRMAARHWLQIPGVDRDDLQEVAALVKNDDERILIGFGEDGIDLAWSSEFLRRLALAMSDKHQTHSFDRTDRRVFNVRNGAAMWYASTQIADGYVGDIMQIPGRTTAVPVSASPLRQFEMLGQSNAGERDAIGADIEGYLAHDHILRTDVDDRSTGSTAEVPGAATDLISRSEPRLYQKSQSPVAMIALAVHHLDKRADREQPGTIVGETFQGSQPIEMFLPDAYPDTPDSVSPLYENCSAHFANVAGIAPLYGRSVEPNLFFMQGENAGTYADYLADLEALLDTHWPAYSAVTLDNAVPHVFVFQTQSGVSTLAEDSESGSAQLSACRARVGDGATLIGPTYQSPLGDNIHFYNIGMMINGETAALVYEWVRIKGEDWEPLWPTAGGVTRSGAEIRIPMELPLGTTALSFDTDWILANDNYGFWYDDDSGSPPAISTVAIDGSEIVVTLASDPGSETGKTIGYATKTLDETAGWASSRGQLYADSGVPSVYAGLGFAVPATIRHYCVRFTESLT